MHFTNARRPLVVIMGVSGSGKSTVGNAVSQEARVPYADADEFHPVENIDKMRAGLALDDDDRRPWLDAVGKWLAAHFDGGVMSCSALKRRYRDQLRHHVPELEFLYLHGSREVIAERQQHRHGHFMPTSLLTSQLATLEPLAPDEAGYTVDIDQPIDAIVAEYLMQWRKEHED